MPNISVGITSGIILGIHTLPWLVYHTGIIRYADSQMIGNIIERQFKSANDWPFGSALSFILIYITIIILGVRYVYSKLTHAFIREVFHEEENTTLHTSQLRQK